MLKGTLLRTPQVAPQQSYGWLRPFLPKRLQPWLRGLKKRVELGSLQIPEPYNTVYPYTQSSPLRQENLVHLTQRLRIEGTAGAIVECGVLDGGTAALMANASQSEARPIHLFDAWQGLPDTVAADGEESKKWVGQVVGSPRRVLEIMAKLQISPERIHLHKGWFHETFPTADIHPIALLHIDCDFYEPTGLCLSHWYERITSGGYIQFDDYGSFQGCTRAVDEFLAAHPELRLETFGPQGQGEAFFLQKP
jgi:O-methyltransferase